MIPLPYARHKFVHPGIMVSKDMLDQLRANVAGKKEPVKPSLPWNVQVYREGRGRYLPCTRIR